MFTGFCRHFRSLPPISRSRSVANAVWRHLGRPGFVACLLALTAARAVAAGSASPADEVLRFVSADVGFCFVARDLRARGAALAESPFVAGLRKTRAGEAIVHGREVAKLDELQAQLKGQLGMGWEQLRDDIFGDAVVFAYRPGPPDKPEAEEGLMLLRARAAAPLAELVARLNELQKRSGEVSEIEERRHNDAAYFCRVERDRPPLYYHLRGPVLLLSSKESMLLRAIDLERETPAAAEPAVARHLRDLGVDRAVLALWVNPRAFDAQLAERAKLAGHGAASLRVFSRYWQALDGVALALTLDKDVSLGLAARARPADLPPAARRFFSEASRPSDLWHAFPDGCLLAAAWRVDFGALAELVAEFLPEEGGAEFRAGLSRALGPPLGKDFSKDVLPCLGPDLGFCAFAPAPDAKAWSPQGFAALKVAPGGDPDSPVDRALVAAAHSVAQLVVWAHNSKDADHPLALKTAFQGKREVQYLFGEGALPPGLQPAFGLHTGYFVVATSPEVLRQFDPGPWQALKPGEPTPLLRVGLKEWRNYLSQRQEPLSQALAEKEGQPPEVIRGRLEGVATGLEFFDRLEVHQCIGPGQVTLTITLQPSRPFKK